MTRASRPTLVRDITIVLVVKVALLVCGYWFFFGPNDRLHVTPGGIRDHLAPPAHSSSAESSGSKESP